MIIYPRSFTECTEKVSELAWHDSKIQHQVQLSRHLMQTAGYNLKTLGCMRLTYSLDKPPEAW